MLITTPTYAKNNVLQIHLHTIKQGNVWQNVQLMKISMVIHNSIFAPIPAQKGMPVKNLNNVFLPVTLITMVLIIGETH